MRLWNNSRAIMMIRRLSVVDCTAKGQQPDTNKFLVTLVQADILLPGDANCDQNFHQRKVLSYHRLPCHHDTDAGLPTLIPRKKLNDGESSVAAEV